MTGHRCYEGEMEEGIKGARREVNTKGEWRRILNNNKYIWYLWGTQPQLIHLQHNP